AEGRAGEARRRRRREGRRRRQGRGGRRQGRLTCTPVCWSLPGTRSWVRLDAGEGRAAMTGAGAFSAAGGWSPVRAPAGAAARAELTPAAVTRIGAVLGVLAALWFSSGDLRGAVAGSVLLGAVLFCDEVRDVRAGPRQDALADWLDVVLGRLREYAVYAGLAIGGVLAGAEDAWAWAAGALIAHALRDTAIASGTAGAAAPGPAAPRRREWSSAVLGGLDPERPPA